MLKCRERSRFVVLFILAAFAILVLSEPIDMAVNKKLASIRKNKEMPKKIRMLAKKPKTPPHRILIFMILGYSGYFILRRLTTSYELTPSHLMVKRGILTRVSDSVEMSKIQDFQVSSNIVFALLGISTIKVFAPRDVTDKIVKLKHLSQADCVEVENHLKIHGVSSITEVIKAKETRQVIENSKRDKE